MRKDNLFYVKQVSLFLFLILFLISSEEAFAKASIGISPGVFEFSLPPGGEAENGFIVSNEGDEYLDKVIVYGTDVKPDKKGKIRYVVPGPRENPLASPASWLTIKVPDPTKIWSNFPYLDLKPGEGKKVKFTLKVPENAVPGDYNSVVFFEVKKENFMGRRGILTGVRVGCRIKVRVQGSVLERVLLQPFTIKGIVIGNKVPFYFRVKNEGNIDHPLEIKLIFLTSSGKELKKFSIEKRGYIYARSEREYGDALRVRNLGFGKRIARLSLTYQGANGDFKVIEKDRAFFALPYSFFVFLVLFLVIAVLFFFFYLDRKYREKMPLQKEVSSEQPSK
jgi:hypothetical protein